VEQFRSFMAAVRDLGHLEQTRIDSEDVTEEFYDVQDQIKNLKAEEESLRRLMQEARSIPDTLAVREHLNRVTRETDRLQGRLKRLKDLSDLSTVTLTVREKKDYVPPESPSFGTSIVRTFQGSLDWLGTFGQWLTLAVVAVLPWLWVLALVVVPSWWLVRRVRRIRNPQTIPPEVLPAGPPPAPQG
jgi:Domain of unknown function (DUF4349)